MKNTLTEENYLKAIFHNLQKDGTVTVNELSKLLNVKMPSVNNMIKKFSEKGWVIYEAYKPLKITAQGRKEAALVVRKHRLTEMFLVEKMNFGWEEVHEIAEQLEHVHSPDFFNKMDELLGFPKFDPHGEPIPDKEGNFVLPKLKKLSQCSETEEVLFVSVAQPEDDLLSHLTEKNLSIGSKIMVVKKDNSAQTILVRHNQKIINLSQTVAENILVRP